MDNTPPSGPIGQQVADYIADEPATPARPGKRGFAQSRVSTALETFVGSLNSRGAQVVLGAGLLAGAGLGWSLAPSGIAVRPEQQQLTALTRPGITAPVPASPAGTSAVVTGQTTSFDPCTLVTRAEAGAILQQPVTTDSGPAPSAQCLYRPSAPAVFRLQEQSRIAQIRIDAVVVTFVTGSAATSRFAAKQALFGKDRDDARISGLGDQAILTGGGDLSVLQGSRFLNVSTQSDRDWGEGTVRYEDVYQKYVSIVEGFARLALPRVPASLTSTGPPAQFSPQRSVAAAPVATSTPAASRDPLPGAVAGGLLGLLAAGAALLGVSLVRTPKEDLLPWDKKPPRNGQEVV